MGLDISVCLLTKKKQKRHFTISINGEIKDNFKEFPHWTIPLKHFKKEDGYDWQEYQQQTGLDVENSIVEGFYYGKENFVIITTPDNKEHKINLDTFPTKKILVGFIYYKEVGYQRKGFNAKFYEDYQNNKIGYFVWTKAELERYKKDYAEDPEEFQKNIIDNFIEGKCVVTFDW